MTKYSIILGRLSDILDDKVQEFINEYHNEEDKDKIIVILNQFKDKVLSEMEERGTIIDDDTLV